MSTARVLETTLQEWHPVGVLCGIIGGWAGLCTAVSPPLGPSIADKDMPEHVRRYAFTGMFIGYTLPVSVPMLSLYYTFKPLFKP